MLRHAKLELVYRIMSNSQRIASYDVMRIVAIMAVLYTHLPAYHLYHNGQGVMLASGITLAALVRIGVPLFAMVSGALLLGRNETYGVLWRKRISRMLLVILIFEALHYACGIACGEEAFSCRTFVYGLFSGGLKGMTSYWFLYAYVGFLIMLPFLRRVAQAMTRSDFFWLLGVHIVCTTLPTMVNFLCRHFGAAELTISNAFVVSLSSVTLYFYPLIGFWIDRNIDVHRITRGQWALLLAAMAAGVALSGGMTWMHQAHSGEATQTYLPLTVYVTAIVIFLGSKRFFDSAFTVRCPRLSRACCFVGSLVFGVYLLDQPLKFFAYEPLKAMLYSHSPFEACGLNSALCFSLVWCALSFVICGAATWGLKRVPWLGKLI